MRAFGETAAGAVDLIHESAWQDIILYDLEGTSSTAGLKAAPLRG
jgi:hypothetical protein